MKAVIYASLALALSPLASHADMAQKGSLELASTGFTPALATTAVAAHQGSDQNGTQYEGKALLLGVSEQVTEALDASLGRSLERSTPTKPATEES